MSEERAVTFLKARDAANIPHLGGSLLDHSVGTRELLRKWENPDHICDAGLCHAVYGTFGFPTALLQLSERKVIVDLIGKQAEQLVYFYASCDRDYVYPRIGRVETLEFRDRFAGEIFVPDQTLLASFMEITFAIEFELAGKHPDSARHTCAALGELFKGSRGLVSECAFAHFTRLCAQA
jgi:hypothetical protein